MLPKLSIIVTAVIAACVAVLSVGIGLVGTGNPVKQESAVPDIGHLLMQQAMVDAPEWQHFQSLAHARRNDELLRLRDLAAASTRTPESADQGDAAPAAPPFATEPTEDVATRAAVLQADQVPITGPIAAAPSTGSNVPAATPAASVQDTDTTAAIAPPKLSRVATPRPNPKTRAEARKRKLAAGPRKQVAGLGATPATPAAEKPAVGASRRGTQVAEQPHKKKRHASRSPRQVLPEASTGFPIDVQQTNGQSTTAKTRFFDAGLEAGR